MTVSRTDTSRSTAICALCWTVCRDGTALHAHYRRCHPADAARYDQRFSPAAPQDTPACTNGGTNLA